jgi:PEP-CTERM motif
MRKPFVLMLMVAAALMLACPAFADTATFTLNLGNGTGGLLPTNSGANGGYGTVTLTLVDSTHISFNIQGFNGVPTGSATSTDYRISDFGFNAASGFVGTLSCGSVTTGWTGNCSASGNLDGMGSYGFIVAGPNGSADPGDHLQFIVTVAGGTFSSVNNLVGSTNGGNCTGCSFAAEIFPFQDGTIQTSTGFAGVDGPAITQTPEPGTLAMFGSGLVGLAGVIRRRLIKR